jgi:predicted transcriptional regulator
MNNTAHHAVLFALWELARKDRPATVLRLATATGLERAVVERSLARLDEAGLVHADRVRLSMQGLAAAVMLGAPKQGKRSQLRAA